MRFCIHLISLWLSEGFRVSCYQRSLVYPQQNPALPLLMHWKKEKKRKEKKDRKQHLCKNRPSFMKSTFASFHSCYLDQKALDDIAVEVHPPTARQQISIVWWFQGAVCNMMSVVSRMRNVLTLQEIHSKPLVSKNADALIASDRDLLLPGWSLFSFYCYFIVILFFQICVAQL